MKKRTSNNIVPSSDKRQTDSQIILNKTAFLQKPIFHIMLIIILGLLAYSNTFNASFYFDDFLYITGSKIIEDFRYFYEFSKIKEVLSGPDTLVTYTFKNRFVGFLTFALNYKISGFDVTGYHIFNLLLHIINSSLVYLLVSFSFSTPFLNKSCSKDNLRLTALFTSLLFVSHPIQTQAVTYISQRFTSLATMFCLISVISYIKSRFSIHHVSRYTLYAISILFAALGMKTKEIAFTLPLIIVLYEFMFFEGKIKKRILFLTPLLFTMFIIPLGRVAGDSIGNINIMTKELTAMSRWDYLFTQFRVIVTYIRLLFLPVNQNLDYDYPLYNSFLAPSVFLSFLFLSSILCLGIYLLYRSRYSEMNNNHALRLISFGIFWFFITLSVESSIFPIKDVIFEHRVYLSSVGAFIAITTTIFFIANNLKTKWVTTNKVVVLLLSLIIVVLTVATYTRNIVWQDALTLWEDVVRKSPQKARGYHELGLAYLNKEMLEKAINALQTAVKLEPEYLLAHSNLGAAYFKKGMLDEAIKEMQITLKLGNVNSAATYDIIGALYYKKGSFDMAIAYFQYALTLNPNSASTHYNIGIVYESMGLNAEAKEYLGKAHILNPDRY